MTVQCKIAKGSKFLQNGAKGIKHLKKFYPSPKQALIFTCLQYKSSENTVGKGGIAHNEQFLLFPQCFLPVWSTCYHFHQI